MSCDWDVFCVECSERCGISDANHADNEIRDLISNAQILSDLACTGLDVRVEVRGHYVDISFFHKHRGHRLAARSEYGEIDGLCIKKVKCCPNCCYEHRCKLNRDHPGECQPKASYL